MHSRYRLLAAGFTVCSIVMATARAEPVVAPDPVDTVQQAFTAIAENQPERVWDILPPSYQADIEQLTTAFAASTDAALWNRTRGLMARLSRVLGNQRELIFEAVAEHHTLTDEEAGQLQTAIDGVGKLTGYLATSPLTDRERLQQGQLRDLLAGEGHALLSLIETLSMARPDGGENFVTKARHAQVESIETGDHQARVRVTLGDEVEEIPLVLVENRWIPNEMAEKWQETTHDMRERIAAMDPATEEGKQARLQSQMAIGMIEGILTAFEQAKSADDLNQIITGLLMVR